MAVTANVGCWLTAAVQARIGAGPLSSANRTFWSSRSVCGYNVDLPRATTMGVVKGTGSEYDSKVAKHSSSTVNLNENFDGFDDRVPCLCLRDLGRTQHSFHLFEVHTFQN